MTNFCLTLIDPAEAVTVSVADLSFAAGVPDSVAVPFPLSWNIRPARWVPTDAVNARHLRTLRPW